MSSSIVMMAEMANTARERLDEMQREHYREIARNHLDDLTDAYAQALQRPDDTCPLFGLVRSYRDADWTHRGGYTARMTCVAHNSHCVQMGREAGFPTKTQAESCPVMQYVRENTR
ncbi:TPA: hypothetical protein HA251_01575 [Candidatus Woesearchaeota archaeon]|nr:hypothetical protein [Candidatus Woesearchaeota archaeon]